MRNNYEIEPIILSAEYVFNNGIRDRDQFYYEDFDENGVFNDGQIFDKPRLEGGKPINGLIYEVYSTGELCCYYYLENGLKSGPNVSFFKNGQASEYYLRDKKKDFHYEFKWFENGVLKSFWRKNSCDIETTDFYNENGKIIKKTILRSPFVFAYDCLKPNEKTEVLWHEHGQFKKIIWKEPDRNLLYSVVEFDEDSNIIGTEINYLYNPLKYTQSIGIYLHSAILFDKTFFINNNILFRTDGNNISVPFTGKVYELYENGNVKSICEYRKGKTFGKQIYYYSNGQLSEHFDSFDGVIKYERFRWFESGVLKSALKLSDNKHTYHYVCFDKCGNVVDKYDTKQAF